MTKPSAGDDVVTRSLAVLEQTNYLRGEALLRFAAHVRALSVEATELRAKLAESEEPGTLHARFSALRDWACRITGHQTFSSRPWELSLEEYVQGLDAEVTRLRAIEDAIRKRVASIYGNTVFAESQYSKGYAAGVTASLTAIDDAVKALAAQAPASPRELTRAEWRRVAEDADLEDQSAPAERGPVGEERPDA